MLNAGDGSLRWAINQANANSGADEIAFAVPGEISLSSALPAITDTVTINGSTVPGFTGPPAVTVNFRGQTGLRFAPDSGGSSLTSLSLVRATWAGVTRHAASRPAVARPASVGTASPAAIASTAAAARSAEPPWATSSASSSSRATIARRDA
ncbi:MAG: hypothetical protein RLZZ21_2420, partial [Planctomycetota bacterium]